MRRIFLLIHRPTPSPDFPLKGYASASRRFDVAARVAIAALYTAEGLRRDTTLYIYLADTGKTLTLNANTLGPMKPHEVEVLSLLRSMLADAPIMNLERILDEHIPAGFVKIYLTEKGGKLDTFLGALCRAPGVVVALGGKEDVPPELEKLLVRKGFDLVSLGPFSYLASHCVAFIHMVLDGC